MVLKTLDMSCDIDKKILLTYFFKKLDTTIDKKELLSISCIAYDSEKENLYACTKRFVNSLKPFEGKQLLQTDVDNTLKDTLKDSFRIQEELIRCDLHTDTGIDYFYVAVIGVDFFLIEKEIKEL